MGIVQGFTELLKLFEVDKILVLHFSDHITVFESAQKQVSMDVSGGCSCAFGCGFMLGSGADLYFYSLSLT